MEPSQPVDAIAILLKLGVTFFFVATNAFFVAAEFALVKVRPARLRALADAGRGSARVARHIHAHLDRYLSACQLGITLSSLILGWLAEPAVAVLMVQVANGLGWSISLANPFVHAVALALALSVVTFLHMTLGEQAPKLWAIARADSTALQVSHALRGFEIAFRPFIWVINEASNAMLRLAGMKTQELGEASHSVDELRGILESSARAGHISRRQRELAENVFGIIDLEVRHIMLPRVDVVYLSLQNPPEENLRILRESGHSRLPLCEVGLDSVIGVVHAKDLLRFQPGEEPPDLKTLARKPIFVPDTQPLARLIGRMQRSRSHCAVVVDEHGSSVGLAFLEDALEELVGPIQDEFDQAEAEVKKIGGGVLEVSGAMALPEAADVLELAQLGDEADTIGGYVVARLGRLPRHGDELEIGRYRATVVEVRRRRIARLRFELVTRPAVPRDDAGEQPDEKEQSG
jgi:CBS domain containing-hemolysin-like protein